MKKKTFLFSIDLEDIRLRLNNPEDYSERVPIQTHKYLEWLKKYKSKCTFFVTGDIAKFYPSLINEIVSDGHEIACHTTNHLPLDQQTSYQFKKDLIENISLLKNAGAIKIKGFRAPIFSLTKNTEWAYDILSELGFSYSSSVLPAKNPFYGWESFGSCPKNVKNNIIEIPVTVGKFGPMTVPVIGGVYFRVLPEFFIKKILKNCGRNDLAAIGYFHPYDIDWEQERYMNPGINNSRFFNFLMYYNRKNVLNRLDNIMNLGYSIMTYHAYIKTF